MSGSDYMIFWGILGVILLVVLIRRSLKGPIFAKPEEPYDVKGCLIRLGIGMAWLFGVPWVCSHFSESAEFLPNGKSGRVVGLNTRNVFGSKCADCGVLRLDHVDSKFSFRRSADLKYGDSVFKQNDSVWRVREVNGKSEVTYIPESQY
jgi:hypothetical protein